MGKRVLVTGASSGIGRDFALIFAEKGYDLCLVARNQSKLSEIRTEIEEEFKVSVEIMSIDLSNNNSAQELFDSVCSKNMTIDILVNNAGFGTQGEHTDIELSKINQMIGLNITTLSNLCSLFGSEMKKNKGGYILNVASTGAYGPMPYFAAYGASKSYVLNFSEALAKELDDYNIVVTCLSPGVTKTNFYNAAGVGDKSKGVWSNKTRMDSRRVAECGVKALFSKKLSVIPGAMNSFMMSLMRFFPRNLLANLGKKVIKKAAQADTIERA